jgi:deoxyribonuclease-4
MWRPTNHKPEAIAAFRDRRAEAQIGGVVCHALYLCNLATPDDTVYEKSIATIIATVEAATAIQADGVIFHIGSHLGSGIDAGLERATQAIAQILEHCDGDTWLLMENSAGTGATVGRSLQELEVLFDNLGAHPTLGLCLDSCHLFASGYDVGDPAAVDELVRELDGAVGLDRVRALHINDSATPLGSNRDRHASLLEGEIGERLGAFLAHPAFQELSAYLETPAVDDPKLAPKEVKKLRELHARWT